MGAESGSTILKNTRMSPQPSMDAASYSSSGIVFCMKVRATIMLYTDTVPTRMTAHMVLYKPRFFTIR